MPWHDVNGSVLFMKYYTIPNTVLVMVLVIVDQVEGKKTFRAQRSPKTVRSILYLNESRNGTWLF